MPASLPSPEFLQPIISQESGLKLRRNPRRAKGVGFPKVARNSPFTAFCGLRYIFSNSSIDRQYMIVIAHKRGLRTLPGLIETELAVRIFLKASSPGVSPCKWYGDDSRRLGWAESSKTFCLDDKVALKPSPLPDMSFSRSLVWWFMVQLERTTCFWTKGQKSNWNG